MKTQLLSLLIASSFFTSYAQNGELLKHIPRTNHDTACSPNIVVDSSFEAGSFSAYWTDYSSGFGTTLCTYASCGFGEGSGPHTGIWWAWFGGTSADEQGFVKQDVILPENSTANLYFFLEIPVCDVKGFADFLKVGIDSDTLFTVTDTSSLCGIKSYSMHTINLDAYCDGDAHNIFFSGHTFSETNFFVDDVSVITCPLTTSVQDAYQQHAILISPNPVKDKLKISFRNWQGAPVKIDIANLMGQSLYNRTLSGASRDQEDFYIDVAGWLEAGIYIVILTSGDKFYTQKIIVH